MKREKRRAFIIRMCTYWAKKIELHNYVAIQTPDGISYGGNQNWFASLDRNRRGSVLSGYGCGLVALGDFFLMAGRRFPALQPSMDNGCFRPVGGAGAKRGSCLERKRYLAYLQSLGKGYLVILPHLGSNAWQIWAAAWRYMRRSGQKGRMYWCVFPWNFQKRAAAMLERGLPVLFCVGPNLNPFRKKEQVPMYQLKDGRLEEICKIKARYMNLTGLFWEESGELYLRVSSWGKCYYISWREYEAYRRSQPPILRHWLSNILYVEPGS